MIRTGRKRIDVHQGFQQHIIFCLHYLTFILIIFDKMEEANSGIMLNG